METGACGVAGHPATVPVVVEHQHGKENVTTHNLNMEDLIVMEIQFNKGLVI